MWCGEGEHGRVPSEASMPKFVSPRKEDRQSAQARTGGPARTSDGFEARKTSLYRALERLVGIRRTVQTHFKRMDLCNDCARALALALPSRRGTYGLRR